MTSYDRAAIFDLDGTLADTVPLIAGEIAAASGRAGFEIEPLDLYPYVGRPILDFIEDLTPLSRHSEAATALIADYRATYTVAAESAARDRGLVIPGVVPMLENLIGAGYRLGAVTAKTTEGALHLVDLLGLTQYLEIVVGTDQVANGKPAPDSGWLALAKLNAEAGATCYVGDAVSDMRMAIACGMRPIGVTTGAASREALLQAGAEQVCDSAAEVQAAIAEN